MAPLLLPRSPCPCYARQRAVSRVNAPHTGTFFFLPKIKLKTSKIHSQLSSTLNTFLQLLVLKKTSQMSEFCVDIFVFLKRTQLKSSQGAAIWWRQQSDSVQVLLTSTGNKPNYLKHQLHRGFETLTLTEQIREPQSKQKTNLTVTFLLIQNIFCPILTEFKKRKSTYSVHV